MQRYSQNNEQEYILQYFKDFKGSFLDIGAYDGITFSNTYALLERGWKGVAIEGSPRVFTKLQANLKSAPVELCHAVLTTSSEGLIDWYDNGDATATMNEGNRLKWYSKTPFDHMKIMTCNVSRIVQTYGTAFDFVSIDVEGGSVDIFNELVKQMPDVKVWCVEHDGRSKEVRACLSGYSVLYENAENILMGLK